jgi:hypothetical protein
MTQGQNTGGNVGQINRPGTAGTTGPASAMIQGSSSNQNTINFKQPGPSSTKGF